MLSDKQLSEAICIYVGYGRHQIPALHPDDLEQALGAEGARALTPKLDEIVTFAVRHSAGSEIDLPNIGRDAAVAVSRKYGGLERRALRAIAWYVTRHWQ